MSTQYNYNLKINNKSINIKDLIHKLAHQPIHKAKTNVVMPITHFIPTQTLKYINIATSIGLETIKINDEPVKIRTQFIQSIFFDYQTPFEFSYKQDNNYESVWTPVNLSDYTEDFEVFMMCNNSKSKGYTLYEDSLIRIKFNNINNLSIPNTTYFYSFSQLESIRKLKWVISIEQNVDTWSFD
jgi:hypothetical protein